MPRLRQGPNGRVPTGAIRDPRWLPGLFLWVRADLGITLNGSNVAAWADQSGNGHHLVQATPTAQPPFNASDPLVGGQPSVGVATGMALTSASGALAQPNTIFLVAWQAVLGAGYDVFDGIGGGRQAIGNNTSGFYYYAGTTIATTGFRDCNAHAFAAVFNGASSAFYVDHSLAPATTVNPGAQALNPPSVAGTYPSPSAAVAEVIVYAGACSPSVVASVFAYFTRYGLASS